MFILENHFKYNLFNSDKSVYVDTNACLEKPIRKRKISFRANLRMFENLKDQRGLFVCFIQVAPRRELTGHCMQVIQAEASSEDDLECRDNLSMHSEAHDLQGCINKVQREVRRC